MPAAATAGGGAEDALVELGITPTDTAQRIC